MNDVQQLKAYGHLTTASYKDLSKIALLPQDTLSLEDRFCGHPDFYDEEIAEEKDPAKLSHYLGMDLEECSCLISCHKKMKEHSTGTGSWPSGCYAEYPEHHSVKYFLDRDTFPIHLKRPVVFDELERFVESKVWGMTLEEMKDLYLDKPMIDVAMEFVNETYRRVGCLHIETHDGSEGTDHNIHVKSVRIPGSTIGIAWFNDGTCKDHVNNHIDSDYRPGLHGLCNLLCHECGHNHDLVHTFSGQSIHHGIMSYNPKYPFVGYSTGEIPYDRPKDPSWPALIRQYGGDPVPGEGTEPEVPLPIPEYPVNGVLTIEGRLYKITGDLK